MSTDTESGDDQMEKINVRVPESLLAHIDKEWEHRGYSSRSEAIRDALRDWVNPPAALSDEILTNLKASREQAEQSETYSADEVRKQLGLDDE